MFLFKDDDGDDDLFPLEYVRPDDNGRLDDENDDRLPEKDDRLPDEYDPAPFEKANVAISKKQNKVSFFIRLLLQVKEHRSNNNLDCQYHLLF